MEFSGLGSKVFFFGGGGLRNQGFESFCGVRAWGVSGGRLLGEFRVLP